MEEAGKQEKPKSEGCLKNILQIVLWIVVPVVVASLLLDWVKEMSAVDEAAKLLIPFHNGYMSVDDYYLTIEFLSANWVLRALICFVPGIMLLAIINAISSSVIKSDSANTFFIRTLMIIFLGVAVSVVWLLPDTKTTIDTNNRQIKRTSYKFTGLATHTMHFDDIDRFIYSYKIKKTSRYEYTKYLYVKVVKTDGEEWLIGVRTLGSFSESDVQGDRATIENLPATEQEVNYGIGVVENLHQLIGKDPG